MYLLSAVDFLLLPAWETLMTTNCLFISSCKLLLSPITFLVDISNIYILQSFKEAGSSLFSEYINLFEGLSPLILFNVTVYAVTLD